MLLPALSMTLVEPLRLILIVPLPLIEAMVTSTVLPLDADTLAMLPVAPPVPTRVKSSVEMLFTGSLKVTVKAIEASVLAGEPLTTMLLTMGATPSMIRALFAPSELAAPGTGRVSVALLPVVSLMVPPLSDSELVDT